MRESFLNLNNKSKFNQDSPKISLTINDPTTIKSQKNPSLM